MSPKPFLLALLCAVPCVHAQNTSVMFSSNGIVRGDTRLRWQWDIADPDFTVGPTGLGQRLNMGGANNSLRIYAGGNPAADYSRLEGFWDSANGLYVLRENASGSSNAIPFLVGINSGATLTFNTDGSALFSGGLGLSAQPNLLSITNNQLYLDGVAMTATPTSFNALTQSGTNASAMNFSGLTYGSAFYITASNNLFMPTPSNIPATPFTFYVYVHQPSTGTCFVSWTNGTFSWAGGSAPISTTNGSAVDLFTFTNDPFTNSILHGALTPDVHK